MLIMQSEVYSSGDKFLVLVSLEPISFHCSCTRLVIAIKALLTTDDRSNEDVKLVYLTVTNY